MRSKETARPKTN